MEDLRFFVSGIWQSIGLQDKAMLSEVSHWSLLVLSFMSALLCGLLASYIFRPIVHRIIAQSSSKIDDILFNDDVLRSACRIVPAVVFLFLAPICFEGKKPDELAYVLIERVSNVYLAVMVLSLVIHILNNVNRLSATHDKLREHYVGGLVQFMKLVAYFLGVIVIVALVLGKNPLSLLAGLGAAATLVMLLFRDSIESLVAGVQLSMNDMLKPGDWITLQKHGIDGYVQKVALNTVKVRNFDNTIATVPPSLLMKDAFFNWKEIPDRGRRVKRTLYIDVNSVRFCTADELADYSRQNLLSEAEAGATEPRVVNLTVYRRFVTEYLRNNSEVQTDKWLMVRQLEHTKEGLPVELYFYFKESEFVRYEQLAAETLEYIIASAARFGVRFYQPPTGRDIASLLNCGRQEN